ncbi:MAG TPA: pilus assembly protein N-terminal domain-containing protein [Rhodopila sp.]|jgi:pilus assembly protein CpaC|nr:pilus assembly protein N-terminal domain-containing protein [Rhodopila sp.]
MAYASVLHPTATRQSGVRRARAAWVSWISIALALGLARGYAAPVQPLPQVTAPDVVLPTVPSAGAAVAQASPAPDTQPVPVAAPLPVATAPSPNAPASAPTVLVPQIRAPHPLAAAPAAPLEAPPLPRVTVATPAHAIAAVSTPLSLEAGTGKVITLSGAAANVFVADPKVAEVRPASATSLFVFGITAGRTTVAALDTDGRTLVQYDLTVEPHAYAARQAQAMIGRLLPRARIQVLAQAKGLLLTGSVNTPQDAAQAVSIAKGFAGDTLAIDNELTVSSPMQVTLNVRIAQMSRTVVRNLGINWSSIGSIGRIGTLPALTLNANASSISCSPPSGNFIPICPGGNFNGMIDALAQDNLAHILAEPNLTVKSGQPASFQAGGEFPIPVSEQNGSISITYKDYGIILSFLPTVLSDGRIDIHVKPEVSELDKSNSVTVNAGTSQLVIPAITVRRAESSVELGSGESFAIAGLLQQTTTDNANSVPGVGETPLIGALFRDTAFQKQDMELVIVVTPYIVRPVSNPDQLHLPTDNYRTPSDIDRLLFMKQVAANEPPVPVKIPGSAGFIVQ